MGDLAAPIAVLACGTEVAATEWVPSYKRAAVVQASLALLATAAGLVRWVAAGGGAWLLGTLLVFSVVPFTLIVVSPTNRRLHAVRTALGLAASILFIWAAGHP